MIKTNVLRILEQAGISHEPLYYDLDKVEFSGEAVRDFLGLEVGRSFKTLCAKGRDKDIFVFVIPVEEELDLRLAAKACGEKKIEMVAVKDLKTAVGYERGSVSPIGMKKSFPMYLEETAMLFDTIVVSGGQKGVSVSLAPEDLLGLVGGSYAGVV